jgi:23S rRNA pseudouridine1911/1915/1917 synthase
MWEFRVKEPKRLDRALRDQGLPGAEWLSRQAWDWLIERGHIAVNGRKALKAGMNLSAGDEVRVSLPGSLGLKPSVPLEPIWRASDGSWAVFDKAVGIDTVALLPWDHSAFASHVAAYAAREGLIFAELAEPPSMEGGLVQRLDRDTSGLVSAAFSLEAKAKLRALFSGGKVQKCYDALVIAPPSPGAHRVWLAKDSGARVRAWKEAHAEAEEVFLNIEVYKNSQAGAWLRVSTSQGRRHVVRAGLAALGAPLLGDTLYGGSPSAPFHQLHAGELRFPGEARPIRSEPPPSFLDSAAHLGLHYSG